MEKIEFSDVAVAVASPGVSLCLYSDKAVAVSSPRQKNVQA